MQQLARLAPGTVRHHQQQRLITCAIALQRLRILARKQQPRLVPRLIQQRRQIREHFADDQLRIGQAKRGQTCGIQRVVDFTRMLQHQHPGAAV